MSDEDPATEGGEQVSVDNARSPAPDAAPENDPQPDALAGDVDIKSGTASGEAADPRVQARRAQLRARPRATTPSGSSSAGGSGAAETGRANVP